MASSCTVPHSLPIGIAGMTYDDEHSSSCESDDMDFNEICQVAATGSTFRYNTTDVTTNLLARSLSWTLRDWLSFRAMLSEKSGKDYGVCESDPFPEELTVSMCDSYLLWILKTRKGKLDKKVTTTALKRRFHLLKTLYSQKTGKHFSKADVRAVRSAIEHRFVKKGASQKARPRSLANRAVVVDILNFLWEHDEEPFEHPRVRLQLSLSIMLVFYLGLRPGEFIESSAHPKSNEGLLYKDIRVLVLKREGKTCFAILCTIRNRKFRRGKDKENVVFPLLQDVSSPALCPVLQLLALGISDGAFAGIETIQDLYSIDPPEGDHAIINTKASVREVPVLRSMTRDHHISPTRIASSDQFCLLTSGLGSRAGYSIDLKPYDFRRGHANILEEHVTSAVRRQRMGHKSDDTFLHYISSISGLDSQAMVHGRQAETQLIEHLRSALVWRDLEAPLPMGAQLTDISHRKKDKAYEQAKAVHVKARESSSPVIYYGNGTRPAPSRTFQTYLRYDHHRAKVIKLFYHHDEANDGAIDGLATQVRLLSALVAIGQTNKETWAYPYAAAILKECCSVCGHRPSTASVRDMTAFNHHLLKCGMEREKSKQHTTLLQTVLAENPRCKWMNCGRNFERDTLWAIAEHIQRHTKIVPNSCYYDGCSTAWVDESSLNVHQWTEHALPHTDTLPEFSFCFECCELFSNSREWQDHCEMHLANIQQYYGPVIRKNVVIAPGKCVFCLNDETKGPQERYSQFTKSWPLHSHISTCHLATMEWPVSCPHKSCNVEMACSEAVWDHFESIHGLKSPNGRSNIRKKQEE